MCFVLSSINFTEDLPLFCRQVLFWCQDIKASSGQPRRCCSFLRSENNDSLDSTYIKNIKGV